MSDRRPLIAGNWKMNMRRDTALALADSLRSRVEQTGRPACDLAVCPPFPYLLLIVDALAGSPIGVGGQDCHAEEFGAHTGDVSATMLADLGAGYVIVGHSERRADHGESSVDVRLKAAAAHGAGLVAIICVGETEEQRDYGATLEVVAGQLALSVPDGATAANTVIAYEPVWAIGTGRTPTLPEVAEVHDAIRNKLSDRFSDGGGFRVLYGGSMKPSNAAELLALEDVDGGLIGGASLKVEDFWAIATAPSSAD